MTVSGCTIARADRQFRQSRDSNTQKRRSRGRSFGRLTDCLNTATCCRSARFSMAVAARPRMNARRKRKMAWMMPMPCRSRSCQISNPTGMCQREQTVGNAISPPPPQNPQIRIFPGFWNRLSWCKVPILPDAASRCMVTRTEFLRGTTVRRERGR